MTAMEESSIIHAARRNDLIGLPPVSGETDGDGCEAGKFTLVGRASMAFIADRKGFAFTDPLALRWLRKNKPAQFVNSKTDRCGETLRASNAVTGDSHCRTVLRGAQDHISTTRFLKSCFLVEALVRALEFTEISLDALRGLRADPINHLKSAAFRELS